MLYIIRLPENLSNHNLVYIAEYKDIFSINQIPSETLLELLIIAYYLLRMQGVGGSNPPVSTTRRIKNSSMKWSSFLFARGRSCFSRLPTTSTLAKTDSIG